jgi:hypothetical protein
MMMTNGLRVRAVLLAGLLMAGLSVAGFGKSAAGQAPAAGSAASETAAPGILTREQAGAILPASVFYRGQSATIQARNSSGIRLAGGRLVLAAVVDTGGYSTAVQQTYQAYLITEVPLKLGEQVLAPGAYGFGFVAGDRMVVMDVGGNEILHAKTVHDAKLTRPNPLQIVADAGAPGHYRLYLGRTYVSLAPAPKQ